MTFGQIRHLLKREYSGSHIIFQIIDTPILNARRGQFVSLAINDERLDQLNDLPIIAIGAQNNQEVLYV